MPPLHLRQEFPTLKAFKEALHAWAIEAHFEPRILKSDTGRVRVGCKRDAECPFVVRCNWERRGGREPLARVTVLKDRHTCLDGVAAGWGEVGVGVGDAAAMGLVMGEPQGMRGQSQGEVQAQGQGHIIPGARVIEQHNGVGNGMPLAGAVVPVLPKVQRNSASRLPFLMDILPRLMTITKETTPVEIRECLLREYGAEVHLQQCRRAKTEILKKAGSGDEGGSGPGGGNEGAVQSNSNGNIMHNGNGIQNNNGMQNNSMQQQQQQQQNQVMFPDMNGHGHANNGSVNGNGGSGSVMNAGGNRSGSSGSPQQTFTLHTATGIVTPAIPDRSEAALMAVGEQPIRCPFCINHRWMRSIKDAVEHMSMHVVV
ncbi:centromere binding Cbh2 protein [Rutstroemia sp. NJR-2017a BVV2]|nr:centromere binding Cbh2 protein [Rutstroemia sp. NJR-2017a BVV2]